MVAFDALNSHFEYMDVVRYWSPLSETYAGGDALVTLLNKGWSIDETVFVEEYWHAGTRLVSIYHIDLLRDGETLHMPVLTNPYVCRLIDDLPVQLRPYTERDHVIQH
jgi:hypothetical protein